jgi:hypothetical protein
MDLADRIELELSGKWQRAQARTRERERMIAAIRPSKPTTTPAEAMRGVVYEDFPGLKQGRLEHAIAQGFALPRIYGALAVLGASSAALCLEGAGAAFRYNKRGAGAGE